MSTSSDCAVTFPTTHPPTHPPTSNHRSHCHLITTFRSSRVLVVPKQHLLKKKSGFNFGFFFHFTWLIFGHQWNPFHMISFFVMVLHSIYRFILSLVLFFLQRPVPRRNVRSVLFFQFYGTPNVKICMRLRRPRMDL